MRAQIQPTQAVTPAYPGRGPGDWARTPADWPAGESESASEPNRNRVLNSGALTMRAAVTQLSRRTPIRDWAADGPGSGHAQPPPDAPVSVVPSLAGSSRGAANLSIGQTERRRLSLRVRIMAFRVTPSQAATSRLGG